MPQCRNGYRQRLLFRARPRPRSASVHPDEGSRGPAHDPGPPRLGVWLEDFDGKRYLDAISSWWVNLFGLPIRASTPRCGAARQAGAGDLAGFTHQPVIALSEALTAIAPAGLTRCFYADNGSSAVEVAVKMSFHYWRNVGKTAKRRFITLSNSYHGETLGALAVGNVDLTRRSTGRCSWT